MRGRLDQCVHAWPGSRREDKDAALRRCSTSDHAAAVQRSQCPDLCSYCTGLLHAFTDGAHERPIFEISHLHHNFRIVNVISSSGEYQSLFIFLSSRGWRCFGKSCMRWASATPMLARTLAATSLRHSRASVQSLSAT